MKQPKREATIKFKFTEKPNIKTGDDVICETEIRESDIVAIERVSNSKVVIRALDEMELLSYNGKKYKVVKDKESDTIELTLLKSLHT